MKANVPILYPLTGVGWVFGQPPGKGRRHANPDVAFGVPFHIPLVLSGLVEF